MIPLALACAYAFIQGGPPIGGPLSILNRPLTWDPYGMYALDADEPLTSSSRQILDLLRESELGRAESLARYRLKQDKRDLVPAWVLTQIVRVRGTALNEYVRYVRPIVDKAATEPVLLYRFHVCRLASLAVRDVHISSAHLQYTEIERNLVLLRDRCRSVASQRLGFAIGLSQSRIGWAEFNREVLSGYLNAHPKKPDVRPLLCRAYVNGTLYTAQGRALNDPHLPQAPMPEACLEVARTLLKDHPEDPFGLFYSGRAHSMLGKTDLAIKEVRKAIDVGGLPKALEQAGRAFLSHPVEISFHLIPTVD